MAGASRRALGLLKLSRPLAAAAAGLVAAAIYLLTMARAVGFVDRGELAAVAATAGIAHPTGYPTLTLLGHVAIRALPLPPLIALNALAALLVAAGVGIMVPLYGDALDRLAKNAARDPRSTVCAALAALGTALTQTWWRQANGFEAYALHALFLPLALWLFLRWARQPTAGRGAAFGIVLGLSFTNHMTTVLILPALLVFLLFDRGARRETWLGLARLVPWIALGLLPYLWLPLRAAANPRFLWGDPDTWQRFVAHVTGWQFRVWMFADLETFPRQTSWFFRQLPGDVTVIGLAVAAIGLVVLVRERAAIAALALALMATTILYAGNYQIRDIDAYYMAAILALGLLAAAGLSWLWRRLGARMALVVGAGWVAACGFAHGMTCDERGNHLAEDLTANLLGPLPANSVLLSTQWDYTVSPGYFLQEVQGLRRDVLVLDPELMRRSWYLTELAGRDSALAAAAAPEIARFAAAVEPFERQRRYDAAVLQTAYVAMIDTVIARARSAGRPVFATGEVPAHVGAGLRRVPWQLASLLTGDTTYVAQEEPRWRFRPWRGRVDPYVATTHLIYGQALAARAGYEAQSGRVRQALSYRDLALSFAPRFTIEDVPPLPLDGTEITLQSLGWFEMLRRGAATR